jgi:DNA adenine methylase
MPIVKRLTPLPAAATNGHAGAKLTAPLKWHGGKSYLARRILALMPPRAKRPNAPAAGDPGWVHYVEPYFGGGAVLLANDPTGISEVANDLDGRLVNFWRVLQRPDLFKQFQRVVSAVPFSEAEWRDAGDRLDDPDPVQRAVAFFVRCRQSLAGRMDGFAPLSRTRTRRGMSEQASAWLGAVEGLPAVHARLSAVVIYNRPALDVIRAEDTPRTLFYLDPPYLHETRASTDTYGLHEMSEADHRELLAALKGCRGKVMLSGYRSDLYDNALSGWVRHDFDIANHAAGGENKRRMCECLWCNFGG